MSLSVPCLSYEGLRAKADTFLKNYNSHGKIPVPIEQIIEFEFGLTIIPLHELLTVYEVDAFISRDLKTIYVDNSVLESRSPNRYRFSLAHELAHVVLHHQVYEEIHFSTATEWKKLIGSLEERDRYWLEWQANAFAGLVLVPKAPLVSRLSEAITAARKEGFELKNAKEVAKDYVSTWLGRKFEVSAQVIAIRLDKDALWPPK